MLLKMHNNKIFIVFLMLLLFSISVFGLKVISPYPITRSIGNCTNCTYIYNSNVTYNNATPETDPLSYHYGNCTGITTDCGYLTTGDNLGNHIATTTLDMQNNKIDNINYLTVTDGTYYLKIDDNGAGGFGITYTGDEALRLSTGLGANLQFFPDSNGVYGGQFYFDSGNAVDNGIHFRTNAGGTENCVMKSDGTTSCQTINPDLDATRDFGSDSLRWLNGWFYNIYVHTIQGTNSYLCDFDSEYCALPILYDKTYTNYYDNTGGSIVDGVSGNIIRLRTGILSSGSINVYNWMTNTMGMSLDMSQYDINDVDVITANDGVLGDWSSSANGNNTIPQTNGVVLYSTYNDSTMTDYSINANTGTLGGSGSYAVGKIANGISHNGGAGYSTYPAITGTNGYNLFSSPSQSFTINLWQKANVAPSSWYTQAWMSQDCIKGSGGSKWIFGYEAITGTTGQIHYHNSANNPVSSVFSYSTGTWYMITLVHNGATNEYKFYVNGAPMGTTTDATAGSGDCDAVLQIGNAEGDSSTFNGVMDEIAIWNTTLTDQEVLNMAGVVGQTIPTGYDLVVKNSSYFGGDINAISNVYANRFYASEDFPHMYGIITLNQSIASINTWQNITFNASDSILEGNLTFARNQTVTIMEEGDYLISMGNHIQDSSASPNAKVAFRVMVNGVQLNGTYFETTTSKQYANQWHEKVSYHELDIGDNLTYQFISDSTKVGIRSANTWNTGFIANGYGWLERID
jgi:hypothetical protein